jgi:RNA polymerase sigma factor (sigma-70 family)
MNQQVTNQVFNIPNLTEEEEIQLFKSVKAGGVAARHKIIEAYMKLVLMIVGKYYSGGEKDDLIQVGNLALIDAVDKFNCNNGVKFSGFVSSYIHGRIKRYLEEDTMVKRPGSLWEDQRMLEKNQKELTEKFGRDPTYDKLYKLTATKWKKKRGWKMSENYFNQLLEAKKLNAVSDIILDQIRGNEINQDATVDINRILSILDSREQTVLRNFYGIVEGKLLSMTGLAKQFGVTKARIYQIRADALEKMKNFLAKDTNLALGTGE